MKVKTSISISKDILEAVDNYSTPSRSRSDFIEYVLIEFFKKIECDRQHEKDLKIINRRANRLNKEALDVLHYQVDL